MLFREKSIKDKFQQGNRCAENKSNSIINLNINISSLVVT